MISELNEIVSQPEEPRGFLQKKKGRVSALWMPHYLSSPDGGVGVMPIYFKVFLQLRWRRGLCAVAEGAWENRAGRVPDSWSIQNGFFCPCVKLKEM